MYRTSDNIPILLCVFVLLSVTAVPFSEASDPNENVSQQLNAHSREEMHNEDHNLNEQDLVSLQSTLREIFRDEKPFISEQASDDRLTAVNDFVREDNLPDFVSLGETQGVAAFVRESRTFRSEKNRRNLDDAAAATMLDTAILQDLPQVPTGARYGYLNEWVVHLEGGQGVAGKVLADLGYESHGTVTGFPNLYRVARKDHPRLHKRAATELTGELNRHDQVVWAEQQEAKVREKRRFWSDIADDSDRPLVRVKRSLRSLQSESSSVRTKYDSHNQYDSLADQERRHSRRTVPEVGVRRPTARGGSSISPWKSPFVKNVPGQQDDEVLNRLARWHPEQERFSRSKGELSDVFNDDLVDTQWYLYDTRVLPDLPRLDMGVVNAWREGLTGRGVRVVILDDGLDYTHDDLRQNYDPEISHDFNDDDEDPMPRSVPGIINSHGTKCAGEVAMVANNGKCGVGVAFRASIGGVRMLDGHVSDRVEAESLSHSRGLVDIVSCSWGPTDDGKTVEGPGRLVKMALEKGVQEGRNGKGTIFIWAAGNGGLAEDNCNCDGYTSSMYTTSINSASQSNAFPWYGERCASTMASTYSSGAYSDQKIISTDLNNTCTSTFSGTSAAAPLAAGIMALALEANPTLTWRDVQHLTVISSNYDTLSANEGWYQNALGLFVNLRFGFGLLDASKLVASARTWQTVSDRVSCDVKATHASGSDWSISSQGTAHLVFDVAGCRDEAGREGVFLEHVQAVLSIHHTRRGALSINITSPRGTETTLLTPRSEDDSTLGFTDWPFMSVHTWGEDPRGTWRLTVTDTSQAGESGTVVAARLQLHAATTVPHYATEQYQRQYALLSDAPQPAVRSPAGSVRSLQKRHQ